jgi:hypothetical protein
MRTITRTSYSWRTRAGEHRGPEGGSHAENIPGSWPECRICAVLLPGVKGLCTVLAVGPSQMWEIQWVGATCSWAVVGCVRQYL